MLIDNFGFFTRELTVPNLDNAVGSVAPTLRSFISEKSEELLIYALGVGNFLELKTWIDGNGNLKDDAPEKWKKLVYGSTFDYNGIMCRWKGLVYFLDYDEDQYMYSLIAKYTYCKWQEFSVSMQSGMGEVVGKTANTSIADPSIRYTLIWNSFVEMYQGNYGCANYNLTGYLRGAFYTDWTNGGVNNGEFSFLNYLVKEANDFPNCSLKRFALQNNLGI